MTTEAPIAIIYPYFRTSGYVYLHIPKRLTIECEVTSGTRFVAFSKDGKVILEQIKEDKENAA